MCQIRDLSLDGCFVESMTTPEPYEETVITFQVDNDEFAAPVGTVVYLESSTSFAVAFRSMTAKERADLSLQIARLLQCRRAGFEMADWDELAPTSYHSRKGRKDKTNAQQKDEQLTT